MSPLLPHTTARHPRGGRLLAFCLVARAASQDFNIKGLDGLQDLFKGLKGLENMAEHAQPGAQPDPAGMQNFLNGMMNSGKASQEKVCSDGKISVPKKDSHKTFQANGCGPQGMQIKEPHGLFRCCNFHDICFSVCGTTHDWCEKEFTKCMKRVCKKPESNDKESCEEQADSFSSLTKSFGAGFHQSSQKLSCKCTKKASAKKAHQKYLQAFLQENEPNEADDDRVEALLKKWEGKEGQLYAGLVKKHGHNFVEFKEIAPEFEEGSTKQEL